MLIELVDTYDPQKKRQTLWNGDLEDAMDAVEGCGDMTDRRIEVLRGMETKCGDTGGQQKDSVTKGGPIKKEESSDDDDDLVILSLNRNHENVKCLKAMGFDTKLINEAWCALKSKERTRSIAPSQDDFIVQMLDQMNLTQS